MGDWRCGDRGRSLVGRDRRCRSCRWPNSKGLAVLTGRRRARDRSAVVAVVLSFLSPLSSCWTLHDALHPSMLFPPARSLAFLYGSRLARLVHCSPRSSSVLAPLFQSCSPVCPVCSPWPPTSRSFLLGPPVLAACLIDLPSAPLAARVCATPAPINLLYVLVPNRLVRIPPVLLLLPSSAPLVDAAAPRTHNSDCVSFLSTSHAPPRRSTLLSLTSSPFFTPVEAYPFPSFCRPDSNSYTARSATSFLKPAFSFS
jgi:hypothetical protein